LLRGNLVMQTLSADVWTLEMGYAFRDSGMRPPIQASGMDRPRQIFLARRFGISVCRGTAST